MTSPYLTAALRSLADVESDSREAAMSCITHAATAIRAGNPNTASAYLDRAQALLKRVERIREITA